MGNVYGKLELDKNFIKTIFELKVGESGYSSPFALEFDYNMDGYLDLNERYENKINRMSLLEMKVTRTGPEKNDFDVNISQVEDYYWKKTNMPFDYNIKHIEDPSENILIAKLNYSPILINNSLIENKETNIEKLIEQLEKAKLNENFELAAKLRDKINNIRKE